MAATNFEEYLSVMVEESPHALVLDWHRRLELAIQAYVESHKISHARGRRAESIIARDPLLGSGVASKLAELRTLRNSVAHTGNPVSEETATGFARECFSLIGVLGRAQDAHSCN
jgi:hypothetical protein